jgi:hypothetical protein
LVDRHVELTTYIRGRTLYYNPTNDFNNNLEEMKERYYVGQVLDDQLNKTDVTSKVHVGNWNRYGLERNNNGYISDGQFMISHYPVLTNKTKPYKYKNVRYQQLKTGDIVKERASKTLKLCYLKLTKPIIQRHNNEILEFSSKKHF